MRQPLLRIVMPSYCFFADFSMRVIALRYMPALMRYIILRCCRRLRFAVICRTPLSSFRSFSATCVRLSHFRLAPLMPCYDATFSCHYAIML